MALPRAALSDLADHDCVSAHTTPADRPLRHNSGSENRSTNFSIALAAGLLLAGTLAGCGGPTDAAPPPAPPPPPPASTPKLGSLTFDAVSSSIAVDGSVQLVVTTTDQNGNMLAVQPQYLSSAPSVATVNSSGLVAAASTGSTLITVSASAGGTSMSKALTINVVPPWPGATPPRNVMVNNAAQGVAFVQAEPSIAVFGSRVVVGWNDDRVSLSELLRGFKHGIGYGYSSDAGLTFHDAGTPGGANWGADPTLTVDRSGNFYLGRIDLIRGSGTLDRISVAKSTDGGATFLQSSTASDGAQTNDKPTIAVDNTGSQFDGNTYASWTLASGDLNIRFSRSTDGGASFSAPIQLSNSGRDQASIPAVGPDGEVYVVWFNQVSGEILIRKSTDGGVSFAAPVLVAVAAHVGELENETQQFCGRVLKGSLRAQNFPSISVDRSHGPRRGTVYVAFSSHGANTDGADVFLTSSTNGGTTWSTPSRLNDDATFNDQWMPIVATAPNGSLAVSWYDRRLDQKNLLIDLFMRISTNGGASFGPNLKITEVSFPAAGVIQLSGFPPYTCYFSSYNSMTADESSFYIVWSDNRTVRASAIDTNVFFAKVAY